MTGLRACGAAGARFLGMEEVRGSIPLRSTTGEMFNALRGVFSCPSGGTLTYPNRRAADFSPTRSDSLVVLARRSRGGARPDPQVHTLALLPEQTQDFGRTFARAPKCVWHARVELSGLTRPQHEVVLG